MRRFLERSLSFTAAHVRALLCPVDLGVLGLAEQGGKAVLVRHSYKSGWLLPGGAVERGEPPAHAVVRELREEIGLTRSAEPQFVGIFTRKVLFATNVIVLYRLSDAVFAFKPGLEIRAVMLADPASPPPGTSAAVRRRFKEILGEAPQSPYW